MTNLPRSNRPRPAVVDEAHRRAAAPTSLAGGGTPDGFPFDTVLVANRGEIAIRVMRSLRELGLRSIAVYSDVDRDSRHVRFADEAYAIGGAAPADSYLRQDVILDVARRAGAGAVHPGYGFLAENAEFARACAAAGVVFVGPTAEAIEAMGSKTRSRQLMKAAGVPVVPGTTDPLASLEDARTTAASVGYPVALKASAGGGGRGFRVALDESELEAAWDGARGEGARYFSDDRVYIERYLHDPRHVEVQILADNHGNVIHLGERDCSVQRRHQKLIEESPAPGNDPELRAKIGRIGVEAARAVDYRGAGTIECLMGDDGEPFFLEMNTRVQVEHTVTEMVTGVDIVAEQLRIAAGLPLSIAQDDVQLLGHAIECRINAELATDSFRPSSGLITRWIEPSGPGVRVDSGFEAGSEVPTWYDTLLAKLIVHAADRPQAIARMRRALAEFTVDGVDTLIGFHRAVLASEEFASGGTCRDLVADPAAAIESALAEWHLVDRTSTPSTVADPDQLLIEVDGKRMTIVVHDPHTSLPPAVRQRSGATRHGPGAVTAPSPGNVLRVMVSEGDTVDAGQVVCILEAMKMENEIAAAAPGIVNEIAVSEGDSVLTGQVLMAVGSGD